MRRSIATVGLLLALGAVTGCSSSTDPCPVFNSEGAAEVSCIAHQTEEPGGRYLDREMRNTSEVLAMMRTPPTAPSPSATTPRVGDRQGMGLDLPRPRRNHGEGAVGPPVIFPWRATVPAS